MASRSAFIGIGVEIQSTHIRAVKVKVDDTGAAVRRFASAPRPDDGFAASVARVIEELDSQKTLPVAITGSLSPDDQQALQSAIGKPRLARFALRPAAIAQLGLAPGTALDSVTELDACSVPDRLFAALPGLRFPDLLGAIGTALILADRPISNHRGGPADAPAVPPPHDVQPDIRNVDESPPAAPPAPTRISLTGADVTQPRPTSSRKDSTPPEVQSPAAPTRISFDGKDMTELRPQPEPAKSNDPAARPASPETAVAASPFDSADVQEQPTPARPVIRAAPPADESPFAGDFTLSEAGLTQRGPGESRRSGNFQPPLVNLAADEAPDQPATHGKRRSRSTARRPAPVALIMLVVLIGIGIALGVLLGGDGSVINEGVTGVRGVLRPLS